MSIFTTIEWCDSSLQLEIGCSGCELWIPKMGVNICYAGILVGRYGGEGKKGWPRSFEEPELFLYRLDEAAKWPDLKGKDRPNKPWLNGLPRLIFLNDLGDTFTEGLPIDWLAPLLPRMAAMPHIFIVLTKRANRMLEFSKNHPFPKNFWLMTSVTSAANYNRIEQLMEVRGGSVKGISYEPAFGEIDLEKWLPRRLDLSEIPGWALNDGCIDGYTEGLNWVVAGGASGNNPKSSDVAWFKKILYQCRWRNASFFLKQLGGKPIRVDDNDSIEGPVRKRLVMIDKKGGDMQEWPSSLRIRQMPI